jgi:hypothetical protein
LSPQRQFVIWLLAALAACGLLAAVLILLH